MAGQIIETGLFREAGTTNPPLKSNLGKLKIFPFQKIMISISAPEKSVLYTVQMLNRKIFIIYSPIYKKFDINKKQEHWQPFERCRKVRLLVEKLQFRHVAACMNSPANNLEAEALF